KNAMALWKARNLVEHHRGIAHLPHIDIDEAADLLLKLRTLDGLQLARGFDALDPVPQILVGHVTLPGSRRLFRRAHFLVPHRRRPDNIRTCGSKAPTAGSATAADRAPRCRAA